MFLLFLLQKLTLPSIYTDQKFLQEARPQADLQSLLHLIRDSCILEITITYPPHA